MPDVKEVINALEMSYKYSNVDENSTLVPQWVVLHVIELLKGQEPRIIAFDELENDNLEVIWFEAKQSTYIEPMLTRGKDFNDSADWFKYGRDWRCWTQRPTDEQRKAVKWDDT